MRAYDADGNLLLQTDNKVTILYVPDERFTQAAVLPSRCLTGPALISRLPGEKFGGTPLAGALSTRDGSARSMVPRRNSFHCGSGGRSVVTAAYGSPRIPTAYQLSVSILTQVIGHLGDVAGKRRMMLACLATFAVGPLGRSWAVWLKLIAGRVIQGAAGRICPLALVGHLVAAEQGLAAG